MGEIQNKKILFKKNLRKCRRKMFTKLKRYGKNQNWEILEKFKLTKMSYKNSELKKFQRKFRIKQVKKMRIKKISRKIQKKCQKKIRIEHFVSTEFWWPSKLWSAVTAFLIHEIKKKILKRWSTRIVWGNFFVKYIIKKLLSKKEICIKKFSLFCL